MGRRRFLQLGAVSALAATVYGRNGALRGGVMEDPYLAKVREALLGCLHGEWDQCVRSRAIPNSSMDNSMCATILPYSDDTVLGNLFDPGCVLDTLCTEKYVDKMADLEDTVYTVVPPNGWFEILELLPPEIRHHFAIDGIRSNRMDPRRTGEWACQSFLQLAWNNGTRFFQTASNYTYDKLSTECRLFTASSPETAPKLLTLLEEANAADAQKRPVELSRAGWDPLGFWGPKKCGCRDPTPGIECEPLNDSSLVDACLASPTSRNCSNIDAGPASPSRDLCQTNPTTQGCMFSPLIASRCMGSTIDNPLPDLPWFDEVTVGPQREDVFKFLVEQSDSHDPGEFAGMIGLDTIGTLGARARMFVPIYSYANACRNLLSLVGTGGVEALPNHTHFHYDVVNVACTFFRMQDPAQVKSPATAKVASPVGKRYVMGGPEC